MDYEVKKAKQVIFDNEIQRRFGDFFNHDTKCKLCGQRYGEHMGYECPPDDANILPSSEMKLITDEEVDQYCANKTDCPYDKKERDRLCRDCQHCTQEAQLLACKKAHAGMTKELVDSVQATKNPFPKDSPKYSAVEACIASIVTDLKARYGG